MLLRLPLQPVRHCYGSQGSAHNGCPVPSNADFELGIHEHEVAAEKEHDDQPRLVHQREDALQRGLKRDDALLGVLAALEQAGERLYRLIENYLLYAQIEITGFNLGCVNFIQIGGFHSPFACIAQS